MLKIRLTYDPIDDKYYLYRGEEFECCTQNQEIALHMFDLLCDIEMKESNDEQ
jgi:hypothetical protein